MLQGGFEEREAVIQQKVWHFRKTDVLDRLSMLQSEFEEREAAIQHKMDSARDRKTQLEQTQRYKKEQMVGCLFFYCFSLSLSPLFPSLSLPLPSSLSVCLSVLSVSLPCLYSPLSVVCTVLVSSLSQFLCLSSSVSSLCSVCLPCLCLSVSLPPFPLFVSLSLFPVSVCLSSSMSSPSLPLHSPSFFWWSANVYNCLVCCWNWWNRSL